MVCNDGRGFRRQLLGLFVVLAKIVRIVIVHFVILHRYKPTFNYGCSANFENGFVCLGSPACQRFVLASLVSEHNEF